MSADTKFVADLQDNLRGCVPKCKTDSESSSMVQKDAYDKGVKHTVFPTGDLVLHYTPQLKPGEAGSFAKCGRDHM